LEGKNLKKRILGFQMSYSTSGTVFQERKTKKIIVRVAKRSHEKNQREGNQKNKKKRFHNAKRVNGGGRPAPVNMG